MSEANVSLSPESGSLFHYYHSKLTGVSMNESPEKEKPKFIDRDVGSMPKRNKHKKRWIPSKQFGNQRYSAVQRLEKYPALQMTDVMVAEDEAEKHCTKIFHLKDSSNSSHNSWMLPSVEEFYISKPWKVEKLLELKEELNMIKSQLDLYDIDTWHNHTQLCNPAQKVAFAVKGKVKPELITQAFLKFYEILHAFPIVPDDDDELPDSTFSSLHLCEAPGAFIVALNHYLALHKPDIKWQWLGNTLNPHFEGTPSSECIADDRFILHTLENWCFGKDETGNLMSEDYLEELLERIGGRNKLNLVTADGSIDCQKNPAEQEAMTFQLHFCEVYTALHALDKGGSLVLKKFTIFESESVCLVYLICCCFDDVFVYKPITSKLGNSEVYLVAVGYNPTSMSPYMEKLKGFYGKQLDDISMISQEAVPQTFFTQIIGSSRFFKDHQADAIQRNIDLYKNDTHRNRQYTDLMKCIVLSKFLDNNLCRTIDLSRKLVHHKLKWDINIIPENYMSKWGGSIMKKPKAQRHAFLNEQFTALLKFYNLNTDVQNDSTEYKYKNRLFLLNDAALNSVSLKIGKPFHCVFVSRFCHTNLLQICIQYFRECVSETELNEIRKEHNSELKIYDHNVYKSCVSRNIETILSQIRSNYDSTIILDEGQFPAPHSCHKAFDKVISMITEGKIDEKQNIAMINCQLFTRRQVGLLYILSCLFEKAEFFEPSEVPIGSPFFIFINFLSKEKGHLLVKSLKKKGWFDDTKHVSQILPLQELIPSYLYPAVCRFNSQYCLNLVWILRDILK